MTDESSNLTVEGVRSPVVISTCNPSLKDQPTVNQESADNSNKDSVNNIQRHILPISKRLLLSKGRIDFQPMENPWRELAFIEFHATPDSPWHRITRLLDTEGATLTAIAARPTEATIKKQNIHGGRDRLFKPTHALSSAFSDKHLHSGQLQYPSHFVQSAIKKPRSPRSPSTPTLEPSPARNVTSPKGHERSPLLQVQPTSSSSIHSIAGTMQSQSLKRLVASPTPITLLKKLSAPIDMEIEETRDHLVRQDNQINILRIPSSDFHSFTDEGSLHADIDTRRSEDEGTTDTTRCQAKRAPLASAVGNQLSFNVVRSRQKIPSVVTVVTPVTPTQFNDSKFTYSDVGVIPSCSPDSSQGESRAIETQKGQTFQHNIAPAIVTPTSLASANRSEIPTKEGDASITNPPEFQQSFSPASSQLSAGSICDATNVSSIATGYFPSANKVKDWKPIGSQDATFPFPHKPAMLETDEKIHQHNS